MEINNINQIPLISHSVRNCLRNSVSNERLNGDHEMNMSLMMVLFEQLYDQFSEYGSHTPAQRLSHQNEIAPNWVGQRLIACNNFVSKLKNYNGYENTETAIITNDAHNDVSVYACKNG